MLGPDEGETRVVAKGRQRVWKGCRAGPVGLCLLTCRSKAVTEIPDQC